MRGIATVSAVGTLILVVGFYIATAAQEIKFSISELATHVNPEIARIQVMESETTETVLSKTLEDGTTITQTYHWDGTPEDAERIRKEWETFCAAWE